MTERNSRAPGLRSKPAKEADPERQATFRTGLSAENRAATLLVAKGFRIVARTLEESGGRN